MKDGDKNFNPNRPQIYFDISIGDEKVGQIVFELFQDVVPKTTEHFRSLSLGLVTDDGRTLHYKGSIFHRVIKGLMVQGGNFTNSDGTCGESMYAKSFKEENFQLKHNAPFLLSMTSGATETSGGEFFITTGPAESLDENYLVFGKVVKGKDVVRKLEHVQTVGDKPTSECKICDCGEIQPGEENWVTIFDDGTGDQLPDLPSDSDCSFNRFEDLCAAIEAARLVGNNQFKEGKYSVALHKYLKAVDYINYFMKEEDAISFSGDSDEEEEDEEGAPPKENLTDEDIEKNEVLEKFKVPCLLNTAACRLKLNDCRGAVVDLTQVLVLDDVNLKALYRRAQAYVGMKEYDEALDDLMCALRISPEDKAVKHEIANVKNLITQKKKKDKKLYSKLFA